MTVQLQERKLTVQDYHRMIEAGILTEDDRVELLDGKIVQMSPIGSQHTSTVKRINQLFSSILPDDIIIGIQDPIILPDLSEPEPDVSVLKPSPDFYAAQHPQAEDVLLLIEVADSTLEKDREIKLPLYAKAGIPEVWIVNLPNQQIERHYQVEDGIYRHRELYAATHTIPLTAFGLSTEAANILG